MTITAPSPAASSAPDALVVAVKGLCAEWSTARLRRMLRRPGVVEQMEQVGAALTPDQLADLRLLRWSDEARLLGDPEHVDRMAAAHEPVRRRTARVWS